MPGPQRDAERTRHRLLDAAASAITERGPDVSLAVIARRAGVSKGGLLHHFPTREDLLAALMAYLLAQFDELVEAELQHEPEGRPGRLVRAYIRAVFADLDAQDRGREQLTLMGQLGSSPAVSEFLRHDEAQWAQRVAADGMDPLRAELLMKAADGATASLMWARTPAEHYRKLRSALLALAAETGPLT